MDAGVSDAAAIFEWRTAKSLVDLSPLTRIAGLRRESHDGAGSRYYVRHVSAASSSIIGYVLRDPEHTPVRLLDLIANAPEHQSPPPPLRKRGRTDALLSTGGDASPPSPPDAGVAVDTTLYESLLQLERTFRVDPQKAHLMTPIVNQDKSPLGLALLGQPTFDPLFRTFRTLFSDRRAAFRFASQRVEEDLPSLSQVELRALEQECQQLWRGVHTAMLRRIDRGER